MGRIDDIVGSRQQLIQVARKVDRARILPQGGQVGGNLPIEQAQLLKLAAAHGTKAASVALIEQGLEPEPVRLAFFDPAGRDHA